MREGQIRKKGLGGFISYNSFNGKKNDIVRMESMLECLEKDVKNGRCIDLCRLLTK